MRDPSPGPRLPLRWAPAAAALAAIAVLAACSSGSGGSSGTTSAQAGLRESLVANEWLLDHSASSLTSGADAVITIAFAPDGTVSGLAACNRYTGRYSIGGDGTLTFGPLAQTRKLCEPALDAAEREYAAALAKVRTAAVTGERLVLRGEGIELGFAAIDVAAQIVGDWDIVNVATARGVESVLPGTEPTIGFGADHAVTVETGCNTLSSTWSVDGRQIAFTPPAGTQKHCPEPAGVGAQAQALAQALEGARAVEVTPDTLTLLREDGTILLVATRA
jgi:heat shock protein HslJ